MAQLHVFVAADVVPHKIDGVLDGTKDRGVVDCGISADRIPYFMNHPYHTIMGLGARVQRLVDMAEGRHDFFHTVLQRRAERPLDEPDGIVGLGQAVLQGRSDQRELRGQAVGPAHHRRIDGGEVLRIGAGQRRQCSLDEFFFFVAVGEARAHRRLDQFQPGRQGRGLVLDGRFDGREFCIGRSAQRFEGQLQQFLLRIAVGKAVLDGGFDQPQFRLQAGGLALDRRVDGGEFLFRRAGQRIDRLLDERQRFPGIGQPVLQGCFDEVELGRQGRGLAAHRRLEGLQAFRQRARQGLDSLKQQVLRRFLVGQAVLHRRFDQRQFRLQARGLALDGAFHGGQLVGQGARQGFERRLKERLLRLVIGEALRHRRLDQAEFRLQARGLAFHGRLDGRQTLGQRAGQRGHGLLQQRLRGLAVGEAAGHRRLDQLQFFCQRAAGAAHRIDDLVVVRLDGDADVGPHVVARREKERQEQQQDDDSILFHKLHHF